MSRNSLINRAVCTAASLFLLAAPAARAEDLPPAQFEKAMEQYLSDGENLDKLAESIQKHFEKKRMEQARKEREQEERSVEDQLKNPTKVELGESPVKGNKDAKIAVVEFSDFQCPYCQRGAQVMDKIAEKYPNDVKIAFKHFPLPFHPKARPASRAAMAAGKQGKFWEMHDKLFSNQQDLSDEAFAKHAKDLGLDVDKFQKDMKDPALDKQIDEDMAQGQKLGINGTPGFLVNGVKVQGAREFEYFQTIIEKWKKQLG